MASEDTWAKLRYFKKDSPTDNYGDTSAIDDDLLLRLDDFRHYLGVPVYLLHGVEDKGHEKNSYHSRLRGGKAADIVCPQYTGHPIDLVFTAMRFGFSGIGYYPHWEFKGLQCGGLHLDVRPLGIDADGTLNYGHSLWMGIKISEKQADGTVKARQEYIPLTYANIIRNTKGA